MSKPVMLKIGLHFGKLVSFIRFGQTLSNKSQNWRILERTLEYIMLLESPNQILLANSILAITCNCSVVPLSCQPGVGSTSLQKVF